MKSWMLSHHATSVDTIQLKANPATDVLAGAWMPLDRKVDALSKSGGVYFDASFRSYVGTRVIATTADCLIATDGVQIFAYVAAAGVSA